jgi:hypothetical protein
MSLKIPFYFRNWRPDPPGRGRETRSVVVDVIEEPAPGVIAVTEIEETQIPAGRDEKEEC